MTRCFVLAVLLLLCCLVSPTHSVVIPANFTARLDAWVTCLMSSPLLPTRPPELSLAVVANGATLLAKGYGADAAGRAITTHTLFGIGSVSKAFTSTLMSTLMNASLLDYDTPLSSYPTASFSTYSPYIDAHATLRDLLTHHTGISRADFLTFISPPPNATTTWHSFVPRTFARLPPLVDFREYWVYNNFAVAEAALMLERIAGQGTWEVMMQRMLTQLGMTDTLTSAVAARQSGNMATPYTTGTFPLTTPPTVTQLPPDVDDWADLVSPAGSFYSSASDMATWMLFHLGSSTPVGIHADLTTLHSAQVTSTGSSDQALYLPNDQSMSQASLGYAFGWEAQVLNGHQTVTHDGAVLGFWSFVELFPHPDDGWGVFVSTPAVNALVESLVALWVDLEMLGHDNYLARAGLCPQEDGAAAEVREGDRAKMEAALAARAARRQRERDVLLPLTIRSTPSAEVTALLASIAPVAAVDPALLVGVYDNTRGGAWGQMHVALNQSNADWPLTLHWHTFHALLRPTPPGNATYDGFPLYDALILAPPALVARYQQLPQTFLVNAAEGGVRGVWALVDAPIPYFERAGTPAGMSSTGGGEVVGGGSSSTGGGGGGEVVETRASAVLLTTALSIVSLLLLAVVVYAVWITKKYRDVQDGNSNPARSDLNDRLI